MRASQLSHRVIHLSWHQQSIVTSSVEGKPSEWNTKSMCEDRYSHRNLLIRHDTEEINLYVLSWRTFFMRSLECYFRERIDILPFEPMHYSIFLNDRPLIWPWIKSIYNELDIAFNVLVSQLLRHKIYSWRHRQSILTSSATTTRCRCMWFVDFVIIYRFVVSCT